MKKNRVKDDQIFFLQNESPLTKYQILTIPRKRNFVMAIDGGECWHKFFTL